MTPLVTCWIIYSSALKAALDLTYTFLESLVSGLQYIQYIIYKSRPIHEHFYAVQENCSLQWNIVTILSLTNKVIYIMGSTGLPWKIPSIIFPTQYYIHRSIPFLSTLYPQSEHKKQKNKFCMKKSYKGILFNDPFCQSVNCMSER